MRLDDVARAVEGLRRLPRGLQFLKSAAHFSSSPAVAVQWRRLCRMNGATADLDVVFLDALHT